MRSITHLFILIFVAFAVGSCDLFPVRRTGPNKPLVQHRAFAPVASGRNTAEFPGGMEGLRDYLVNNTEYPPKALAKGIEGRVFVRFVVTEKGEIENVEVTKGAHKLLNAEAIRVVESMPRWKPARERGRPVRSYFNLPVNFKL